MDKDERIKEIGKRLAIARKARKKTQEEVAAMLGTVQNTWTKYESGSRSTPIEIYIGFAEKLHISLDWLLTGKGTMENGRKEKTLEEMTVKDVGTALAALATVTIIKASQKIPKFGMPSNRGINAEIIPFYVNVLDETSRLIQRAANYFVLAKNGINAEIIPRKYLYVGGTGYFSIVTNPLSVDTFSETSGLLRRDAEYKIEDRRGVLLCDFLARLSDLQGWLSKDDHISRGEETFNKNLAVLLESLPNLPMAPLPATINQRENVSLNNPKNEKDRLFYRI